MKIIKQEQVPPDVLYHGTAKKFLAAIKEKGLLPQKRQYVHLSLDITLAYNVEIRHDKDVCILQIDTKQAMLDGILRLISIVFTTSSTDFSISSDRAIRAGIPSSFCDGTPRISYTKRDLQKVILSFYMWSYNT